MTRYDIDVEQGRTIGRPAGRRVGWDAIPGELPSKTGTVPILKKQRRSLGC